MKYTFLLFFFSFLSHSQLKTCNVEYKVSFLFDEDKIENKEAKNFINLAKTGANNINFHLTFNDNFSLFKIENKGIKSYEEEIALIFTGAENSCYTDKKNNINYFEINENQIFKKNEFILVDSIKKNWTITNESKKIDKYTCYKATMMIDKKEANTKNDVIVIAWFAPELPFSFGPNGFSGLPGLILELNIKKNIFLINKLVFENQEKTIEKPTKGKEISIKYYNNIISERTPSFKKFE